MIRIAENVVKQQKNFWNNCLFHPTDAVEDPWGKKILDRMSDDKAIDTVRIYAMLEDIVYLDGEGNLAYDFRLADLRLDYLVEKGYNILIAYGMMPECIASNKNLTSCVSKNKTRYKGKLINTSVPTDYKLWEEICFEFTKHIVERYGIEVVSKWHLQCFNEPDIGAFFMTDVHHLEVDVRVAEYCKLYTGFVNGALRVSDKLCVGGPALAWILDFLEKFLNFVKESGVRLDYISIHNYAHTDPASINNGTKIISVENWMETQQQYIDVIEKCGFGDTELVLDEWGMASAGFFNVEECPAYMARETEAFSAYYVKMIYKIIEKGWKISKQMICLSGQHEMTTDFSGFRNFFTLNFFAKPIYNAHILASKLHSGLVTARTDNKNLFVIPTKNDDKNYSVLMTYSLNDFKDDLPEIIEEITFEENVIGKKVTVWCIDKNTTNPYRLYEKMGIEEIGEKEIQILREEGNIKPVAQYIARDKIEIKLTSNAVYLIEVE